MRYLPLLFTLLLLCCKKDQDSRSIEIISYKWIFRVDEEPRLSYSVYAEIESSGLCRIVKNGYDRKSSCIITKIDESILNRLFLDVDTLKNDHNFSPFFWPSPKRPSLYDGPFIKMIVNDTRTINIKFLDCCYDTSTNTSYKLYKILMSQIEKGEITDDTSEIFEKRDQLIENLKNNNDFVLPAPKIVKIDNIIYPIE